MNGFSFSTRLDDPKTFLNYPNHQLKSSLFTSARRFFYTYRNKITDPLFKHNVPYINRCPGYIIVIVLTLIGCIVHVAMMSTLLGVGHIPKSPAFVPLILAFVLATRNSVIWFLFGLSFDKQLLFHKFFAYISVAFGWTHGVDKFLNAPRRGYPLHIAVKIPQVWTGIVLVCCMSALVITGVGFKWLSKLFETFLRIHWFLFICVFVFSFYHKARIVLYVALPILGVDLLLRLIFSLYYRGKQKTFLIQKIENLDVVKIEFDKKLVNFHYKQGQYVFLTIPQITFFENHPFSLETSPYEDKVRLFVRVLGDWTRELMKVSLKQTQINCLMDGPYGSLSWDIQRQEYQVYIFFSGGIGITPVQSIAKTLLIEARMGRNIKKLYWVYTA